jgi:hypothetical protein
MTLDTSTTTSLEHALADVADRIAEHGTSGESQVLHDLAAAAHAACPGAADALVDWSGPEVARLRAFAVVAAALLRAPELLERGGDPSSPRGLAAALAA